MTFALAWLRPRAPGPLTAVPDDAAWLSGPRYDGLLAPTIDGEVAAVDLLTGPDGRAAALADDVPPGAAIARLTAAWVHTGRRYSTRLAILVPTEGPRHRRAGEVHRQAFRPDDIAHLGGVAVTTPLRTAVDLLCFDPTTGASAAVAALLRAGLDAQAVRERLATGRVPVARAERRLTALVETYRASSRLPRAPVVR